MFTAVVERSQIAADFFFLFIMKVVSKQPQMLRCDDAGHHILFTSALDRKMLSHFNDCLSHFTPTSARYASAPCYSIKC